MKPHFPPTVTCCRYFTTEEFATAISMKAQSIRKRYSVTGSYHGVRPVKLLNRRLLWPGDALESLINQGQKPPEPADRASVVDTEVSNAPFISAKNA